MDRLVTSALGQDIVQFLNLALCTSHGSQSSLGQLSGTLVFGVLEQFHNSALVWHESNNLTDECAHKFGAFAENLRNKH